MWIYKPILSVNQIQENVIALALRLCLLCRQESSQKSNMQCPNKAIIWKTSPEHCRDWGKILENLDGRRWHFSLSTLQPPWPLINSCVDGRAPVISLHWTYKLQTSKLLHPRLGWHDKGQASHNSHSSWNRHQLQNTVSGSKFHSFNLDFYTVRVFDIDVWSW